MGNFDDNVLCQHLAPNQSSYSMSLFFYKA